MDDQAIARVIHAAFRQMRKEQGNDPKPEWENVDADEREMFVEGVTFIRKNPRMTPAEIHDLWARKKAEQGYVQGDKKCDATKTSNCFVPYSELSEIEKLKDVLFRDMVLSLTTKV